MQYRLFKFICISCLTYHICRNLLISQYSKNIIVAWKITYLLWVIRVLLHLLVSQWYHNVAITAGQMWAVRQMTTSLAVFTQMPTQVVSVAQSCLMLHWPSWWWAHWLYCCLFPAWSWHSVALNSLALNSLQCADVLLRNCSPWHLVAQLVVHVLGWKWWNTPWKLGCFGLQRKNNTEWVIVALEPVLQITSLL